MNYLEQAKSYASYLEPSQSIMTSIFITLEPQDSLSIIQYRGHEASRASPREHKISPG